MTGGDTYHDTDKDLAAKNSFIIECMICLIIGKSNGHGPKILPSRIQLCQISLGF